MTMNRLSKQIEAYIAYKRNLGFKIKIEADELRRFAAFTESKLYEGSVCNVIVQAWIESKPGISEWYAARRRETVGTFANYIIFYDEEARPIPKSPIRCHGRTDPFIYSQADVLTVMAGMEGIHSHDGLRALTAPAIVGLLWSTGLRPQEALSLKDIDVDLDDLMLHVRGTKFTKSRNVPISHGVAIRLDQYRNNRQTMCRNGERFFLWTYGKQTDLRAMEYTLQLTRNALLPEGHHSWARRPPHLYDLRHSFACHTLERWLLADMDVHAQMPRLSAYLGHVKIEDTYWYLTGTPELLSIAASLRPEGIEVILDGQ